MVLGRAALLSSSLTQVSLDRISSFTRGPLEWQGAVWGGVQVACKHIGKAKTNQAAKKRFRIIDGGHILRGKAGHSHNTGHRSSVRMARLRQSATLEGAWVKRVKRLLGVA